MTQYTLSILKPDVIKQNIIGKVNAYIEGVGISIVAQKRLLLTKVQAETFYFVHKDRAFFSELVKFMISGPVVVQVLAADDVINRYRDIMGATDPQQADVGTIRADFAQNIDANCVHGSDSKENAVKEICFFFAEYEIVE